MNAFDERKFSHQSPRGSNLRFRGNRRDDGNSLRFPRWAVSREQRRKHTLRRIFILILLLLMFITGAFGALRDNPVTTMFRDEISKNLPAPYLEYFNSFLRAMSEPPIGSHQQTAQDSPASSTSSESGIDVVGFLLDLFTPNRVISVAQMPQATQQVEVVVPSAEPPASSTQPTQSTQPTILSATAVPTSLPTIAPTTPAPVIPAFFSPPRQSRPTSKPPVDPPLIVDTAPSVISTTPANGTSGVLVTSTILINFSEVVTVSTASFTLDCSAFNVSGSGTSNITLTPTANLPANTLCTVTVIAAQVSDTDGIAPVNMLADSAFSFTTVDTAPSVTSTTPSTGAITVSTSTTVVVNFSETVTVTGASFTLECPVLTSVVFTVSGTGTNAITLTPSAALPYSTTCTVTVIAAQVSDTDGIAPLNMAADYTFSFTTQAPPVDTAPSVTSTVPSDLATGIAATTNINIIFSEPVTVDTTSFMIECPVGTPQTYAVAGSGTNTITLTPAVSLPAATCTVTVVAANVTDVDAIDPPDTMAADYIFTFITP